MIKITMKKIFNYFVVFFLLFILSGLTSWQKDPLKHNLMVYTDADGNQKVVKSANDWYKRRNQILDGIQQVMGPLPDASKKVPLDIQIIEETQFEGVKRIKISFATERNDR